MILSWSCRTDCRCSRLKPKDDHLSEISISCDGRNSITGFREKVAAGESGGAAANWIANHLFQRDPITLAAMSLTQTKRMRVTLMAMSPLTVHPVQAVMAAATLTTSSFRVRVSLCLGVGAPANIKSIGIGGEKSLADYARALELARALLAGETVTVNGEFFHSRGRRLAVGARSVPLVLAASAERCWSSPALPPTGCFLSAGTSVEFVTRSIERVHRGAKGRPVTFTGWSMLP